MERSVFEKLLSIDSTSGRERALSEYLAALLPQLFPAAVLDRFEVGDGTENLLLRFGTPRLVFCTHMDTVPPYLPPVFEAGGIVRGRGSCDAKGQIFAMLSACEQLAATGQDGFALLLLSGEETGSFGAKAFARLPFKAPFLLVGEPTENKMVSASKGTKSYDLVFHGQSCHSGYPEWGVSAVDLFHRFYRLLQERDFGMDPDLGETSWNVGLLRSDNPQNVLSGELGCRLYFRTTFVSDTPIREWMRQAPSMLSGRLSVTPRGGDAPSRYLTLPGFACAPVAFGSDAPHLSNFEQKMICGPGSIRVAHRDEEQVTFREIDEAAGAYVRIFGMLSGGYK